MSSHTHSLLGQPGSSRPAADFDLSRARKTATIAASTGVFIDWGPDLPARYPGGRARVLVANPTTLFVAWESERPAPERWSVDVELADGRRFEVDVPGKSPDVWLQVPAGVRGQVHLVRIDSAGREEVAVMPFRTPADGPSWRTDERWGRVGVNGQVMMDVPAPRGGRVEVEDPVGFVAVGYEAGGAAASSGSFPKRT